MTLVPPTRFRDKIPCENNCEVPQGFEMIPMPTPRHAWTDIARCPHCGLCFLMRELVLENERLKKERT